MNPTMTIRKRLVVLAAAFAALFGGPASSAAQSPPKSTTAPTPHWLWLSDRPRDHQTVYFRKTFRVGDKIKVAQLAATCDNRLTVYLNGEKVVANDAWETPAIVDVTSRIREGDNLVAIEAQNRESAAGLIAKIGITFPDGSRQWLVTDRFWQMSDKVAEGWHKPGFDAKGWRPAHVLGPLGMQPWQDVAIALGGGVYTAQATPADHIKLPNDFRIELLYSVPKATQGSWVSMTPDPKGRLIVSDQDGSLYRVTAGKTADDTRVEKIDVNIGMAQGLLWAEGSLYVVVNGGAAQGSGLYRVRDTDGDDRLDDVALLKRFEGGGEHGPHAVRLGPDGKLYVIAGNFTKVPIGIAPTSPHRNYAEDLLLPRNPDGNGFATGVLAPGGWICRTDVEGRRWELFCAGFRNPYDIAFNQDGEIFSYDADMEWDTGTSWYRPTRVNHAVSAAEFGWRFGTGKWPAYYADSLGAVVDIGLGSPTGLEVGTGARLPAKYQRALFINDWTYGKIYAVHMRPQGASYVADFEVFVEAKPLPVTDICVNHDGALYFAIGGRRTQSGLYRVTYTGAESVAPVGSIEDPASAKARALRRRLEAFHGGHDAAAIDTAWPHLDSADRHVRYAARVAIEWQESSRWLDRAFAEKRPTAAVHAMLAVARTARADALPNILSTLSTLPLGRLTEEQMLDLLRVYGVSFARLGRPDAAAAHALIVRLNPLFPAQSEWVNRELCQVLLYLDAPTIVERCMKRLLTASTQEDQVHYAFVLRNARHGWSPELRRDYFNWLSLAEAKYRGGASFKNFIIRIRKDAAETLSDDQRVALADIIEGRQKIDSSPVQPARQFIHNWQLDDLLPLLDRVERGRSFERGQAAYQAAQCYKCHRFNGDGGATGPDLTGAGNRFSPRDLLESIVTPSKVISDQYRSTILRTRDGEVITGRIIEEDDKKIRVRTDPFASEMTEIAKSAIEERAPSPTSEMPQGAINVLAKEEILDLIAYLRSAGNAKDRSFSGGN
jgi:putative heme-binding domain-containing protein